MFCCLLSSSKPSSDISSEHKFLEWTLCALSGPYEENETATKGPDAQIRERIASFPIPQRAAILAFLRLCGYHRVVSMNAVFHRR